MILLKVFLLLISFGRTIDNDLTNLLFFQARDWFKQIIKCMRNNMENSKEKDYEIYHKCYDQNYMNCIECFFISDKFEELIEFKTFKSYSSPEDQFYISLKLKPGASPETARKTVKRQIRRIDFNLKETNIRDVEGLSYSEEHLIKNLISWGVCVFERESNNLFLYLYLDLINYYPKDKDDGPRYPKAVIERGKGTISLDYNNKSLKYAKRYEKKVIGFLLAKFMRYNKEITQSFVVSEHCVDSLKGYKLSVPIRYGGIKEILDLSSIKLDYQMNEWYDLRSYLHIVQEKMYSFNKNNDDYNFYTSFISNLESALHGYESEDFWKEVEDDARIENTHRDMDELDINFKRANKSECTFLEKLCFNDISEKRFEEFEFSKIDREDYCKEEKNHRCLPRNPNYRNKMGCVILGATLFERGILERRWELQLEEHSEIVVREEEKKQEESEG